VTVVSPRWYRGDSITSVAPTGAGSLNQPSRPVSTRSAVPSTPTLAPATGRPCVSMTRPRTVIAGTDGSGAAGVGASVGGGCAEAAPAPSINASALRRESFMENAAYLATNMPFDGCPGEGVTAWRCEAFRQVSPIATRRGARRGADRSSITRRSTPTDAENDDGPSVQPGPSSLRRTARFRSRAALPESAISHPCRGRGPRGHRPSRPSWASRRSASRW
jgi:hypothetical protein